MPTGNETERGRTPPKILGIATKPKNTERPKGIIFFLQRESKDERETGIAKPDFQSNPLSSDPIRISLFVLLTTAHFVFLFYFVFVFILFFFLLLSFSVHTNNR